jgi:hypothetical protein
MTLVMLMLIQSAKFLFEQRMALDSPPPSYHITSQEHRCCCFLPTMSRQSQRPIFLAGILVVLFILSAFSRFNSSTSRCSLEETQYKGTVSDTFTAIAITSNTALRTARTGLYDAGAAAAPSSGGPEDDEIASTLASSMNRMDITFYHVAKPASLSNQNTALVWIVHAQRNTQYSVMAVVPGQYTKAALQLPTIYSKNTNNNTNTPTRRHNNKKIRFLLQLPFAAEYQLLVHEIQPTLSKQYPRRIPPFLLSDRFLSVPDSLAAAATTTTIDNVATSTLPHPLPPPPCQSVAHQALLPWQGDWIGPRAATAQQRRQSALRTGWSFVPNDCVLETFTPRELHEISISAPPTYGTTTTSAPTTDSTTIAVLGTSRERGIFLSMVDMMLNETEKASLRESKAGKCWGRASVRLNNLKVIYQDTRTHLCNVNEVPGTITCHDRAIAVGSGFLKNATEMINVLFANHSEQPQVVVLWSGVANKDLIVNSSTYYLQNEPQEQMKATSVILSAIPRDWNGTIYLTSGMMDAKDDEIHQSQYENYVKNLQWFQTYLNDPRVRMLDVYRLATDMKLYDEEPGKIHGSTHFHRWCNEKHWNRNDNTTDSLRVCSNVTEVLANLVLGRAIAPLGKAHRFRGNNDIDNTAITSTRRELEICTDCPAKLMPFHIIPRPQLECSAGHFIPTKVAGPSFDNHCPATCLNTTPVGEVMTQSGRPVKERVCIPDSNPTAGMNGAQLYAESKNI